MFSAKKVLENMDNDINLIKDIGLNTNQNYEDLIARINNLREQSEDDISDDEDEDEDEE
jgi:hypothetical protein